MKLNGSTENKINKDKNGENVLHSENNEIIFVNCYIVKNSYQKIEEFCIKVFQINYFCQLLEILATNVIFLKTFSYIEVWFTD